MAKKAMICPFSGSACRDCGIYRGRHQYLCYRKEYRGYLLDKNNKRYKKTNEDIKKNIYERDSLFFHVPKEILKSSAIIRDVEDIVAEKDFKNI